MLQTIIALREKHQLHTRKKPLEYLSRKESSWHEQFPLPVHNEIAINILNTMVKTVAETDELSIVDFHSVRILTNDVQLKIQFEFAKFIELETIFSQAVIENIPLELKVELFDGEDNIINLGSAFKTRYKEKTVLKMPCISYSINNTKDATRGYAVRFKNLSDIIESKSPIICEEIDHYLPWVFIKKNDNWQLEGVASIQTASNQVRILYPDNLKCISETNFITNLNNKILIEATGIIELSDIENNLYIIKTNAKPTEHYYLQGKNIDFTSVPNRLYLGIPELWSINNKTAISKRISKKLIARPVNSKDNWDVLSPGKQGFYEIRLQDKNIIKFSKRCVLLPENFTIRLKPENEAVNGTIYLENTGTAIVSCNSYPVIENMDNDLNYQQLTTRWMSNSIINNQKKARSTKDFWLSLRTKNTVQTHDIIKKSCKKIICYINESPPAYVAIILSWSGTTEIVELRIPFPNRNCLLIKSNKNITYQELYQDDLQKSAFRLINEYQNSSRNLQIEFTLNNKDLYFRDNISRKGLVINIAIADYLKWTNLLFFIAKPDDFIKITLYECNSKLLSINVFPNQLSTKESQDDNSIIINYSTHTKLSKNQFSKIKIMAMQLSQPEREHIAIESNFSKQKSTNSWIFYPKKRTSEHWLIYPAKDSPIFLRPIVWIDTHSQKNPKISPLKVLTLHDAVILDEKFSSLVIQKILLQMCFNFEHSGWKYLQNLWNNCAHLPLNSFDVWILAVKNPNVLVAWVLQMDEAFINKLTEELFVFWELIPLKHWLAVFTYYKLYLQQEIDNEIDVKDILLVKIERLNGISASMKIVGKILKQELCSIVDDNFIIISTLDNLDDIINRLIDNVEKITSNEFDKRPIIFFKTELLRHWKNIEFSQQQLLTLLHLNGILKDNHTVIILPVLLAVFCINGRTNFEVDSLNIFKLNSLKSFDEEWFNTAFQFSLYYLLQITEYKIKLTEESSNMATINDKEIEQLNQRIAEYTKEIEEETAEFKATTSTLEQNIGQFKAEHNDLKSSYLELEEKYEQFIAALREAIEKRDNALKHLLQEVKGLNARIHEIRMSLEVKND